MKKLIFLPFFLIALYLSASASDGNCQIIDHSINPPDYAETEEEKVLRLERELLLALEYYDGCLEVVETSSSSSPSASSSATGEQVQFPAIPQRDRPAQFLQIPFHEGRC